LNEAVVRRAECHYETCKLSPLIESAKQMKAEVIEVAR
jgi:hypothetical protein